MTLLMTMVFSGCIHKKKTGMTEANEGILQLPMGEGRCENVVQPANNNNNHTEICSDLTPALSTVEMSRHVCMM
jgi:hypothetical protein